MQWLNQYANTLMFCFAVQQQLKKKTKALLFRYCIVTLLMFVTINSLAQESNEVEGQSSIIIDNRKDILHVANAKYRRKLIEDATINAIRQAVPTIVNFEEYSYQDYDEANHSMQPSDRMIFQFKSGRQVQWQQSGNPVITHDLRTKNKWNCKVRGFVTEISAPVTLNAPQVPVEQTNIRKPALSNTFGLGYGLSLPQVFEVPLLQTPPGPVQSWQLTIYPLQHIGIQFGVSRELSLGLYFSFANIKLLYASLETTTPCYGGRVQLGFYRHTLNPYFALYALYGDENACAFGIKGAALGIDFLKGRFKIGIETLAYWVSSDMEYNGARFSDNTFFTINNGFNLSDLRFNLGVGLKLYFF
jgi:hypothetical protein